MILSSRLAPVAVLAAVTLTVGGCASVAPQRPRPAPDAAFLILGEDGAAIARAIVAAPACPAIEIDGDSRPMAVRAAYGTIAPRPAGRDDARLRPASVAPPVTSCEAPVPAGARSVAVGGHSLPLPQAGYKRIVVLGDTGCRLKGREFQDCNDPQAYPFATVAASAAAWKPDLVVHVGDFHYREDPCPAGRHGCAGSPYGYGWDAWKADFFDPARSLLAAAPWVLARGNHETCARGGQGWWRFLDPRPLLPGRDCERPADDDSGDHADPYAVPLGGQAQLVVFDSANTSWKGFTPGDARFAKYGDTWRQLDRLTRRMPYNIAVDHHPLYAFGANRDPASGAITLFGGDAGLTQAFGALDPRLLPAGVQVLLSGHVHLWEQTSFATDHPTQFVAGFAGTAEDIVPLPASPPNGATPAPGARVESMSSWIDGFGFMSMERTGPDAWEVVVHDRHGKPVNTCSIAGRRSRCAVAQVKPAGEGGRGR